MRNLTKKRNTLETKIKADLTIEGTGKSDISTGVGFFDHMLTLLTFHAGFDLSLKAEGDIDTDDHHTLEDVGIVLGEMIKDLTRDKTGLKRYAYSYVPMDEALSRVVLDVSNRPGISIQSLLKTERIGQCQTQSLLEFLKAFATEARLTVHIDMLKGENDHHIIESVFKALGRALKEALTLEGDKILSTKGVL